MEHIPNASAEDAPATPSLLPTSTTRWPTPTTAPWKGCFGCLRRLTSATSIPIDIAPEERLQPVSASACRSSPPTRPGPARHGHPAPPVGRAAALAVTRAACSDEPGAGTAVYRFARYAIDEQSIAHASTVASAPPAQGRGGMGPCPKQRGRAFDITHPAGERLLPHFALGRSGMRAYAPVRALPAPAGEGADVWFARVNPGKPGGAAYHGSFRGTSRRAALHHLRRVHHLAGVYDGGDWQLVNTEGAGDLERALPDRTADEAPQSEAWRTFYKGSIDARYHPELRRQFMPKRLRTSPSCRKPRRPAPALR